MTFTAMKKIVSVITFISFIATNSIYAAPESKSIFKNKKVDYQKINDQNNGVIQKKKAILNGEDADQSESQKKEAQKILASHLSDISLIHIPSELGRIVEVYQNPNQDNAKLIVHIQDLHTNPEAEMNLAKILELLLNDYKMGLICSEGAVGPLDTKEIASFPDYAAREKVGRIFVNAGELTGEEYLAITKYPDLPIWGIETEGIYFKNIIDFNKIMKFNPRSQVFISQAKKGLEELKTKIYTKELLELDQKEADYKAQKIETPDYISYLANYTKKLNIPTADYKNIALLTETMGKEKTTDQLKVMNESQNILLNLQSSLMAKSLKSDSDSLMAKAQLFRDQKISPFSFYSYLKDLANRHLKDDFTAKYPNLNGFVEYLTRVNSLDSTNLFIELENLNFEIKEALSKTDEQKNLVKALRNINFLDGFFNLKVSNEELDYYLNNRDSHKVAFFESFMKPAIKKYNINTFIDYNASLVDPYLTELEEFYKVVKERDLAMVNNSLSEIEKRNSRVSTLIAGGFHTKGITKLLREKGYSYIIVSPYSKTEINEENYHFLLSGQRKPIEELMNQLDLKEIVNRLTGAALRVPLSSNTAVIKNFNEKVAPILSEISGIPLEKILIQPGTERMMLMLSLQKGAEKTKYSYEIKLRSDGALVEKYVTYEGKEIYIRLTPGRAFKAQKEDFIGTVRAAKPQSLEGFVVLDDKKHEYVETNPSVTTPAGQAQTEVIASNSATVLRRFEVIKESIGRDSFLREQIPSELIARIESNPTQQAFVIKGLYELVLEYLWTVNEYCNRPELTKQKDGIISNAQNNIYNPLLVDLNNISIRLENGDLVPNAVELRSSEGDREKTPKINITRKPKVVLFPMKGDPWQLGHKWCIYKLLGDGADIIVTMEDNADPDRKPDLSSLALREPQSDYLYSDVFAPFVVPAKFQRQYRRLFQCDGESIMPTLIYENLEIANLVDWIYDAGYDHCNWTIQGKDGLDTPYKLFFSLKHMFRQGVNINMTVRFQKREGDSRDDDQATKDKYQAIEAVAKVKIIEFLVESIMAKVTPEKRSDFWGGVKAWLHIWQHNQMREAENGCSTERAKDLFRQFYEDGEKALSRLNVKVWRKRFEQAITWERGVTETKRSSLDIWFDKLSGLSRHSGTFDYDDGEGRRLAEEFSNMLALINLDISMKIEVFNQPMDTASTMIRKEGLVYTAASLPIIQSMMAMRFYPSYQDAETTRKDKEIATEALGDLIDIDFMCIETRKIISEQKLILRQAQDSLRGLLESLNREQPLEENMIRELRRHLKQSRYKVLRELGEDKQPIASRNDLISIQNKVYEIVRSLDDDEVMVDGLLAGQEDAKITKRILTNHLGEYLSDLVDMDLLLKRLNSRVESNAFKSILLYTGSQFDSALENMRIKLEGAYGSALHIVDGYLVKCFSEDDMFNKLVALVTLSASKDTDPERKARQVLDRLRDVVQHRAEQIVAESRAEPLASGGTFTLASNEGILVENVQKLSRVKGGIVAGVGLPDIHGRVFKLNGQFFNDDGSYAEELQKFMDTLSDKSIQEMIHAGIMYYDIRSKYWKDNPAFTVAFAFAFAKKLQEIEGRQDGIVLHIGVDAYHKHFETAQVFADAILRTGICDNGGGIYYWGVINGGDTRNYGQLYHAMNNGKGGNWVYFTMSHVRDDFIGAKLGRGAKVYCGSEIRHCEGVTSGTLYDAIVQKDFVPVQHNIPVGNIVTVSNVIKNNIEVAADMIRATSDSNDIPTNELLKSEKAKFYVLMGGSPMAKNLVDMLKALGADIEVENESMDKNFNTANIIDPNELNNPNAHPLQVAMNKRLKDIAKEKGRTVLVVDPDADRGSIVAINEEGEAIALSGSKLLLLAMEPLARSYKAKGLPPPTVICDMRTGVSAKDLAKVLNERGFPIKVVPHEAGYPFFMRGMASLPADLAVENTTHAFMNPMTNPKWGAPEEYRMPNGEGYQGGDNAALFLIYLAGCMVHQWEGRTPAQQLEWLEQEYGIKKTIDDERKPKMPVKDDKYKYIIADRMKMLAKQYCTDKTRFLINFDDPKVSLVSGVHLTNAKTGAMVLVRFSNTGSTFTISGEAYYRKDLGEGREREDLDEMLGLGYWIMITAVNQLRDEGHVFDFDPKDAAELANEPIFAEMNKVLAAESQRSGAVPIGRTLASNEGALNAFISPRDLAIAQRMLLSGDLIIAENGIYTPRFQNSETASYNSRDKVVEFARKLSGTELLVRVKKGDDLVKVLEGFAKTVIEADKLNLDRHRAAASGI